MDSHAQLEIREFANAIYQIIKPLFPMSVEAFEDYRLDARSFSAAELDLIVACLDRENLVELSEGSSQLSSREVEELKNKLRII